MLRLCLRQRCQLNALHSREVVVRRMSGCSSTDGKSAMKTQLEKVGIIDEDPLKQDVKGFDKVYQRAASIMINVSERTMMKVLHVHCGGRLGYFLGQVGSSITTIAVLSSLHFITAKFPPCFVAAAQTVYLV